MPGILHVGFANIQLGHMGNFVESSIAQIGRGIAAMRGRGAVHADTISRTMVKLSVFTLSDVSGA